MSQDFVRQKLRSPASAKFPLGTNGTIEQFGLCHFRVTSHVDAENAFGASIRSKYVVELQNARGTDNWTATSVKID